MFHYYHFFAGMMKKNEKNAQCISAVFLSPAQRNETRIDRNIPYVVSCDQILQQIQGQLGMNVDSLCKRGQTSQNINNVKAVETHKSH